MGRRHISVNCACPRQKETCFAWQYVHRPLLNVILAASSHSAVAAPRSGNVDMSAPHLKVAPLLSSGDNTAASLAICSLCCEALRVCPQTDCNRHNLLGDHAWVLGAMATASGRRAFALPTAADGDTPASPPVVSRPPEPTADLPDLLHRIITGYDSDSIFASTPAVEKAYAQSSVVLTHKGVWITKCGAVLVPNNPALRCDIVFQAHNTAVCGHGGYHAILNRLKPC